MPTNRYDMIRARLCSTLTPTQLELQDDSHLHAGHVGANSGGHYTVRIVSPQFAGLRTLARHQLVYRSLGEMMQGEIHALSIVALAPDEILGDAAH